MVFYLHPLPHGECRRRHRAFNDGKHKSNEGAVKMRYEYYLYVTEWGLYFCSISATNMVLLT